MSRRLRGAAALAAAAAVWPPFGFDEARAAIVAPPAPAEVESLFRHACWQGLRDPALFRRGLRASSLDLRRVERAEPGEHYAGRASSVRCLAGSRCTIRAHLRSLEAANEIVGRVSAIAPLQASAPAGDADLMRIYRSVQRRTGGGSVSVELVFTPPPPIGPRSRPMYPPAFTLSISAYFTRDE